MNDLKPCPFCGSKNIELAQKTVFTQNIPVGIDWYVLCNGCCSSSGLFISDHDAINAWNRRDNEKE